MIRLTLALIAGLVFTSCMTQADQALWVEAKDLFAGKPAALTAEAPAAAAEPAREIKTSQADKDKTESKSPQTFEATPKAVQAN